MYKFMNNPYLHSTFYAPDGAGAGSGGDGDGGTVDETDDPEDDNNSDEQDDDPEEKKFTQKDIDEAIKKRLSREKRKWQRDSQKNKTDKGDDGQGAGDGATDKGDKEDKELQKERQKAEKLEMKLACFEAGVSKESVDDVSALARAYMADDDDLDFEDAIEKVVKKYPQFKKAAIVADDDGDDTKGKSWGMRQSGRGAKKTDGVEAAFLKRNPGLKID